jgi:hypothetical protein
MCSGVRCSKRRGRDGGRDNDGLWGLETGDSGIIQLPRGEDR